LLLFIRTIAGLVLFLVCQLSFAEGQWSFLVDPTGELTAEQLPRSDFQSLEGGLINPGFVDGHYWLRFTETRETALPFSILYFDKINLAETEFHEYIDGQETQRVLTGNAYPFSQRSILIPQYAFVLSGDVGEVEMLLKLRSRSPITANATIQSAADLLATSNRTQMIYGVLLGFFALTILATAVLSLITREMQFYFGFALMVTSGMSVLSDSGLGYQFLWPDDPWINPILGRISLFGSLTAAGLFTVSFLKPGVFWPRLSHSLVGSSVLLAMASVVPIFSFEPTMAVLLMVFHVVLMLAVIVLSVLKGMTGTTLLSVGYGSFFLVSVLGILASLGYVGLDPTLCHDVGMAMMAVVVTAALGNRLNEEKLHAQLAQQSVESRSRFLATMSHEIRTPMNGVIGMLALIEKENLSEAQTRYLLLARSSASSLLNLINDILDFSKIDAGKLELEQVNFNLVDLIEDVAITLSHLNEDKPIQLVMNCEGLKPATISSDPGRIRQVFTNLISNAYKFTESGEIRVSAELCDQDGRTFLRCSVEDTGIGIKPQSLPRLFETFTQADESTTRKFGGTGLGLAIVKQLCELMEGSVSAKSRLGKGSRFEFMVPVIPVLETQPTDETDLSPSTGLNASQLRLLLVEDNPINLEVAIGILEDVGFDEIDVAQNGQEALESLKENEVDLVLMDCQMPVMDGYEAARQIRRGTAGENNRNVLVIAMTASALAGDREKCLEAGMNDYLSKPIDPGQLERTLGNWLEPSAH
jgi:signal transduction histidine kinase/ActR/RegA family two-component response regulator